MPRELKDIKRLKYINSNFSNINQYLNMEDILKMEEFSKVYLKLSEIGSIIDYEFKDGRAIHKYGQAEAEVVNCTFHPLVDGKEGVVEFNKPGSHIKIPASHTKLSSSAFSISMDIKFEDNNQDRINLFEGSAIPLVLMLVRKDGKYYFAASINLSNGWNLTSAEDTPINPNQWHKLSAVFTGEEVFIFKEDKCIGRRIFRNADLKAGGTAYSFIGTWADGRRNQFKGMISSFKLWDNIPDYLKDEINKAVEIGIGEIGSKYMELGGERSFLGTSIGSEKEIIKFIDGKSKLMGRYLDFKNATIYWSKSTGAHEVHGSILIRYKQLNGPLGPLGFPRTDEINGAINASRINRFENGAIYWSSASKAHEITGHLYAKYITLGGEAGYHGLPVGDIKVLGDQYSIELQRGMLFYSNQSGAHEVHGSILAKYLSLNPTIKNLIGLPTSDELDILDNKGRSTGKKVSNFQAGAIYWSSSTGAYEVHGDIARRYRELGGPSGIMGLPISDEMTAPGTDIRYNNFEKGIILNKAAWGVKEFTNLQLRLGKVVSGQINDGYNFASKDRSAELITFTTIKINNRVLDNGTRRPSGHAGTSYEINKIYDISNIKHDTKIYFKVRIEDWDDSSDNDYLGSIEKTFDISTLWGMDNGANGIYNEHDLTHKGGDSPNMSSIRLSFSIASPSIIDKNKYFRDQFWWRFDNFVGPSPLSRNFYANTFKDVEIIGNNLWEKILNPWDSGIYEIYKNISAKGNCFGMSLEALYAIKNNSLFTIPLSKYQAINDKIAIKPYTDLPAHIYTPINGKHGYQIGSTAVSWATKKILSGDSTSPLATYSNVKRLIDKGDYPIISMMSISKGSGHAVLAYKYEETGNRKKIFVADPNVAFTQINVNGDAGHIDIDANKNSFKFYTGEKDINGNWTVAYESGSVLFGLAPDTFMMEIPYHVVSSQPVTPFLNILLGLESILGGIAILLGDVESEQISSNSSNFYDYKNGKKYQKQDGIKGLARLPILDGPTYPLELYGIQGPPPESLDFKLKGLKDGNYTQYLGSYNNKVEINGPIRLNERDYIHIERAHSSRPNISIKTTGISKNMRISYESLRDKKKKDNILYNINLQVSKDESIVGIDPLGGSLLISQAGPLKEIIIEKEFWQNNIKTKQILKVNPSIENEIIKIKDFDVKTIKDQVLIEKINPDTGKIIKSIRDIFR